MQKIQAGLIAAMLLAAPVAAQNAAGGPGPSAAGATSSNNAASNKASSNKPASGKAPKTPWGDPDLQGTWLVSSDVPLERSAENAGRVFLTDAEVAAADAEKARDLGRNARFSDPLLDVSGAYNANFHSILRTGKRTSLITDPADGRIPVLSPAAAAPAAKTGPLVGVGSFGRTPGQNDNPETIAQSPRCLGVQMPFLPLNTAFGQGAVFQIVQSPGAVAIYMEDAESGGGNRMVYLGNTPHPPAKLRYYLGDSRGHWEGGTLVVETTNFRAGFRGSNPDTYKMTERFTRVDANNLKREVTFEDPKTWSRPWTVLVEMSKGEDHRHLIFDSACHEGNTGIIGILSSARQEDRAGKK